jgi:hypothetical protein
MLLARLGLGLGLGLEVSAPPQLGRGGSHRQKNAGHVLEWPEDLDTHRDSGGDFVELETAAPGSHDSHRQM